MDHRGTYISGIGHAGFVLWALFGGFFLSAREPMPFQSSDVSLITSEQFAALSMPEVVSETAPEPVQPPTPQIENAQPETPEIPTETPNLPASQPEQTAAPENPDQPPKPTPAPRIAPIAAPEPPPDAEISETVTPEVAPEVGTQTPQPEAPATAPQEAATEIVTEAEQPASAPKSSPRPTTRPNRPAPAAEPQPESDPVADAVAEAVASETAPETANAPLGPPMTQGQLEGFRVAVGDCWNVDGGSAAARVTVTVGFSLDRQGKVKDGSMRFIEATDGDQAATNAAYEAARRAIIRCGAKGYDLPLEKYDRWKDIEMTFNPEGMRIK